MKRILMTLLVIGCLAGLSQPGRAADEGRRARRGLKAIEQVVNEMLVDSRNVLVMSSDAARAHVIPDCGVVLAFEANLLESGPFSLQWNDWRGSHLRREGDRLILDLNRDVDDDSDDAVAPKAKPDRKADAKRSAEDTVTPAEKYSRFKAEMADALVDAADYTGGLKNDTWLVISAALGRNDYFRETGIRQLVVRARMADLDAYADGQLTESALRGRIVTEEF